MRCAATWSLAPALLFYLPSAGNPVPAAQLAGTTTQLQDSPERVRGGRVSGIWTRQESPYLVAADLEIGDLTIGSGVEVLVWPGVEIRVRGALLVQGSAEDPVRFARRFAGGTWEGLVFDHTNATSTLSFCQISGAHNSGVRVLESPLVLERSVLFDNSAPNEGGGLFASLLTQDLTLFDCEIRDNSAGTAGGGLALELGGGNLSLDGCLISGNVLEGPRGFTRVSLGGGLHVRGDGTATLTNCLVLENRADSESQQTGFAGIAKGGGVHASDVDLTLVRCVVRSNEALAASFVTNFYGAARGAGISFEAPGHQAVLENCLISDNFARSDASQFDNSAGVDNGGGTMRITNCSVARNRSRIGVFFSARDGQGSAGILATGPTTLENTIVYDNTMSGFYSQWAPPNQFQVVGNVTASYCDVEDGLSGTGNFDRAPEFAPNGSSYAALSFGPFSPCVDAGDPSPAFDDTAFPPSHGGTRNDVGMNGGPQAAGWNAWP